MNINQTLSGFTNYIASQGGLPHLNRFAVEITRPSSLADYAGYNKVLNNLHFTARSVGLPSKTISTNAVMAAGPEQKYPYTDVYDDLTVTFMPTKGTKGGLKLPERVFFEDWLSTVVDNENMLVGFSDTYSTDLRLSILSDQRGSPSRLIQYKFDRAYPIGISAIEFAAASHDLMIFKVTFSYDRWNRVNMEENKKNPASVLPEPKNSKTPDRKDRIWTSDQFHAQPSKPETPERPDRINTSKKTELKKPETPERPDRIWTSDQFYRQPSKPDDPIDRKVGGKADTPTPKKLTKVILGRVANRARAELGIRPMLDE